MTIEPSPPVVRALAGELRDCGEVFLFVAVVVAYLIYPN